MQLTSNFTLHEMIRSTKAIELGIHNFPSVGVQRSLKNLCEKLLQPLRRAYGKPIRITSGYRSQRLNQAVGGSPTSQHIKGEAADCAIDGEACDLLDCLLDRELDFDQAILYQSKNFLHLSLKMQEPNRKQVIVRP